MRSATEKRSGNISDKPTPAAKIYSSYNKLPIAKFLAECNLYDNRSKQWSKVRSSPARRPTQRKEKVLYQPLYDIIQAIFLFFDKKKPGMRWIEKTRDIAMRHDEDGFDYFRKHDDGSTTRVVGKTSPDLCIMGRGMNFCPTANIPEGSKYIHCLAPLEVKTEKTLNRDNDEVLTQVALYVRQCFVQQPHRRYVPTVVFTETHVRLHVYDRSGALLPERVVNYHSDPATFVRIILGISSITGELESSAFDPRVKWEEEGMGSPVIMVAKPWDDVGTRTLRSSRKSRDSYQITGLPYVRSKVWGRGTVCWSALRVVPGEASDFWVPALIKDSWRPAERQNEWELLKEVKGLAGVCQMITYEDDTEYPISRFRNHIVKGLYDKDKQMYDRDRIFCRVVLEEYGESIKHFKSKLQLLRAFYDAVAGHKNLWLKGKILHRDISIENILLGKKDAEVGNRGVLIDLDLAIKVNHTTNLSEARTQVGTRPFQSVAVLKWATRAPNPSPHSHLDDLESFFYVLAWICIEYNGPGNHMNAQYLKYWERDDDVGANAKYSYLCLPVIHLQPYFREDKIIRKLLISLARLCNEHLEKKWHIVQEEEPFLDLLTIYNLPTSSSGEDHNRFLNIIKIAIDALELEPPEGSCPPPNDISPVANPIGESADGLEEPPAPRSRSCEKKRKAEESNEDEPVNWKRTRVLESQEI